MRLLDNAAGKRGDASNGEGQHGGGVKSFGRLPGLEPRCWPQGIPETEHGLWVVRGGVGVAYGGGRVRGCSEGQRGCCHWCCWERCSLASLPGKQLKP